MGIPEERLKRADFGIKMDAGMDAKRAAMMKTASTGSDVTVARSPLSSVSYTDSDDSVDVRVRSPAQPKYRKRPRDSPMKTELDADVTKTESDCSDSERATKRSSTGFVVPKKRFRRDYEASAKLVERSDGESDGGRSRDEESRVPGCARHREVVYECTTCLEDVAKRFGFPAHALRSPAAPPPMPLPLPMLPQLALPFSPFVDPLMAFRALSGDPRLAAGLLAGGAPRVAPVQPVRRPSPPVAARPAPPPPPPQPQEEAPLDLTRRASTSSTASSSSNSSGGSGGKFSIENILAGRTATSEQQHPAVRGLPPRPSPIALSPSSRSTPTKKASPTPTPATSRRTVLPAHGGERRELANERERMRVKHLTGAFKELSSSISGIASECIGTSGVKFTKVAILRTASLYIGYLSHLLSDGAGPTEEKVYDQMRSAILEVMTSKSKKGKDDDDEDEEEM